MATSSKVKFNLETLKTMALKSLDERIALARDQYDSYENDDALARRVTAWRARQEEKISHIFSQLGEGGVDDVRLSSFALDPYPQADYYARRDAEQALTRLLSTRSKIIAKSGSITPDEDGNVSLTKTQMSDFFGL